jgi:hypothetical protein
VPPWITAELALFLLGPFTYARHPHIVEEFIGPCLHFFIGVCVVVQP